MIALVENKHASIKVNSLRIVLKSNITWFANYFFSLCTTFSFFSRSISILFMLHEVLSSCSVCKFWKQHICFLKLGRNVLTLWYVKWVHIFILKRTNCVKSYYEAMRLTRERISFEIEQSWRTEPNNKWKSFYTLIKWVTSSHHNIYCIVQCIYTVQWVLGRTDTFSMKI